MTLKGSALNVRAIKKVTKHMESPKVHKLDALTEAKLFHPDVIANAELVNARGIEVAASLMRHLLTEYETQPFNFPVFNSALGFFVYALSLTAASEQQVVAMHIGLKMVMSEERSKIIAGLLMLGLDPTEALKPD